MGHKSLTSTTVYVHLLPTELPLRSALLTVWLVFSMNSFKIRQIFEHSYEAYSVGNHYQSDIQRKAAHAILTANQVSLVTT